MSKRWVFWVFFAGVLALIGASAALQFRRAGSLGAGRGSSELAMLAKTALAGRSLSAALGDTYEEPLLTKLDALQASGEPRERARALRRKAIWCSLRDLGCTAGALDALDGIAAQDRLPAPADEVAVLREVLEKAPIPPERAAVLEERIAEIRLGWFDRLLRERLHRHAGDTARADAEYASAVRGARLTMGAMIAFMGLLGAGAIAWLAMLAMGWRRRIVARINEGLRDSGPEAEQAGAARRLAVAAVFLAAALAIPLASDTLGVSLGADPTRRAGWTAAIEAALLVLVLVAHAAIERPAGLRLGFERVSPLRAVGVGVFSYLLLWPVLLIVMIPLSALFERLGLPTHSHPITEQLQTASDSPGAIFLWFIIASVLAPILEEAVFRGALLQSFKARLGGRAALFLVALLFAIIHPQVGLGLVGVFVIGLWLSLVRLHERSLWPGVVLHAINNGVALLLALVLLSD